MRVKRGNVAGWQLWLGLKNKAANVEHWQGTYLLCNDDGSVVRITDDDGRYEEFEVRAADTEDRRG